MIKISHELKLKLLNEKEVNVVRHVEQRDLNFEGRTYQVPGLSWHEITLDMKDTPELFSECEEWIRLQKTYFSTSYKAAKINIGQFEGLWPVQCNQKTMVVNFLSDTIYPGRKDWKDWFLEGEEHAPQ
ncbi:hypothetical protein KAR91_65050 [Candidatus Pacearchaeota archaeon]|nr:hypothetical protein [Candidatus Pacearchaeota archaeon]